VSAHEYKLLLHPKSLMIEFLYHQMYTFHEVAKPRLDSDWSHFLKELIVPRYQKLNPKWRT
jgi:hypothetical protein